MPRGTIPCRSARWRHRLSAGLPDPLSLFADRTHRLRVLAHGHELAPYLRFLSDLTEAQYRIQDALPEPAMPDTDTRQRAREFGMPSLDRNRFTADAAYEATLERLLSLAATITIPPVAAAALARETAADAAARETMMRALLADSVPVETLAEHVFVAAALQVHFARLAARLDADALDPVGDGVCPACGGPPVASMVVGWKGAHGTRFCGCALCGTQWNVVRIKCTPCGSTKGITYQEIDGSGRHRQGRDLRGMPRLREDPAAGAASRRRSARRRRREPRPRSAGARAGLSARRVQSVPDRVLGMDAKANAPQRLLPSVDEVLRQPQASAAIARHGRPAVVDAVRAALAEARAARRSATADEVIAAAHARLDTLAQPNMKAVFNLTGTVLHTNLGRALIAEEAVEAAVAAMRNADSLEIDLASGKRGERDDHLRGLLC